MGLRPIEQFEFGGVDSRSNPVNPNPKRSLLMRNFMPREDGHLEIRDGYTPVVFKGQPAGGVSLHSLFSYSNAAGQRFVFLWQDKVAFTVRLSDGQFIQPPIRGKAVASSARWQYALGPLGRLYMVNGTDAKWFDGNTVRDLGLPDFSVDSLTLDDNSVVSLPNAALNTQVTVGVTELSAAENAAITLAGQAGGAFPASPAGVGVFFSVLDSTTNEFGPGSGFASGLRVTLTLNQKIHVAGLPNYGTSHPSWVLLPHITADGSGTSFFPYNTASPPIAVIAANVDETAVPGAAYTNISVAPGHGINAGDVIYVRKLEAGPLWDARPFYVVAVNPDTVAVIHANPAAPSWAGGTIQRILSVPNGTTTLDIIYPLTIATGWIGLSCNSPFGLPISVAGGYQMYVSIYNRDGGGHVGNRAAIGGRLVNTKRCTVHIAGLPALTTNFDSEYIALFGITADGAQLPFISVNLSGVRNATPFASLVALDYLNIDGQNQMPFRNNPPPARADKLCSTSSRLFAAVPNSPFVYASGSQADATNSAFVGDPAQAWDPADLSTHPLYEPIVMLKSYSDETWASSENDLAILGDPDTAPGWQGPWNVGACGNLAYARGWKNLPFWISQEKQLATMTQEGPIPISDEYEAALLAKIGDQYLAQTELRYYRDLVRHVEILEIKARDATGKPFCVIHDFNLRDGTSSYGQGYEFDYVGELAADYSTYSIRDANGKLRVWATQGTTAFQLHDGEDDNGQAQVADAISIIYAGPSRVTINEIEWFGDKNVEFYHAVELDTAFDLTKFEKLSDPEAITVPGQEHNSHYLVKPNHPEFLHCLLWIRLQAHPADGNKNLSAPPHVPLESYGRIYMIAPQLGDARRRM